MRKSAILVSSCLLGYPVRYDGASKPLLSSQLKRLFEVYEPIGVCPEMLSGMPCPRPPSEKCSYPSLVFTSQGQDVTIFFRFGAHLALNICKNYGIRYAILKSKSPSCGVHNVYDGSFYGTLVSGTGVTAQLLSENGIRVFDESQIEKLIQIKENKWD